jgi:acetyltransferase
MATDCAAELGIQLPKPSALSIVAFNKVLPAHWSHSNPIDILGDATAERYLNALDICLDDEQYDAVLVLLTPQAMTEPTEIAEAMVAHLAKRKKTKPVFTAWLGQSLVAQARQVFAKAGIPTFRTPESAVESMHFLMQYQHNQTLLMQVPEAMDNSTPDVEGARLIIQHALGQKRELLSATETRAVLRAFNIPITPAIEASDASAALIAAESLGFPVAFKINSPDITHKSDSGGVQLNITRASEVNEAFTNLIDRVKDHNPSARITGVTVEPMSKVKQARELLIGVTRDPIFGPAISFGSGGTAVEVLKDSTTALPPLNEFIARNLISRTKISKMLGQFRDLKPVNQDEIVRVLLHVSDLVSELPEIIELDLNPLFASPEGLIAVDARIRVARVSSTLKPYAHMAIHPYPADLQKQLTLPSGLKMQIRPIKPEDARMEEAFVASLSEKTKYLRFMQTVHQLSCEMLVRFTQIDYDSEMAFVALAQIKGKTLELGVTRYTRNPDGQSAEFALVVRDDYQHQGIGSRLLEVLIQHAQSKGLKILMGEVLAENHGMLELAKRHGFRAKAMLDDPGVIEVTLEL